MLVFKTSCAVLLHFGLVKILLAQNNLSSYSHLLISLVINTLDRICKPIVIIYGMIYLKTCFSVI